MALNILAHYSFIIKNKYFYFSRRLLDFLIDFVYLVIACLPN
jgi:hypothetical protein